MTQGGKQMNKRSIIAFLILAGVICLAGGPQLMETANAQFIVNPYRYAAGGYSYFSADFDGTNDYCSRGGDLTGNADGKLGIVSSPVICLIEGSTAMMARHPLHRTRKPPSPAAETRASGIKWPCPQLWQLSFTGFQWGDKPSPDPRFKVAGLLGA